MAAMNIKSDVTDQFYRYKMPKLLAKVRIYIHLALYSCGRQCSLNALYVR